MREGAEADVEWMGHAPLEALQVYEDALRDAGFDIGARKEVAGVVYHEAYLRRGVPIALVAWLFSGALHARMNPRTKAVAVLRPTSNGTRLRFVLLREDDLFNLEDAAEGVALPSGLVEDLPFARRRDRLLRTLRAHGLKPRLLGEP